MFAANIPMRSGPCKRPLKRVLGSSRLFRSRFVLEPEPTFAARKHRSSTVWKASAARYEPSRRFPAIEGLFGKPTIVNNVLTLAAVPHILAEGGAEQYGALGIERSRGTMPIQLAGNIRHGGLFETAFGISLRELVYDIGGGTASGRPVKAVQVGGPLGAYIPPDQFDLEFDYESYGAADALIGHGGVVVFDETADMGALARFAMEFCAAESCGKCTPCRIGSVRGVELIDRIRAGGREPDRIELAPQMHNARRPRTRSRRGAQTPRGSVRDNEVWLALRARRVYSVSSAQRAASLAGGLHRVILGVVLAGGQSSRFGSDKALAELGGRTLLARAIDALATCCDHVVVAGRASAPRADCGRLARARAGPFGRDRRGAPACAA